MSVPILYVQAYPQLANSGGDGGQVAICADDASATHLCVLATVGGVLTFTLTSAGSALTSGTYFNVPGKANGASLGNGATFGIGVSATGIVTVDSVAAPGYGFKINDTITLSNSAIGTASSVLTTITVNTVLPCSAPFPVGTKFVEINCDVNGPAFITMDSTMTSVGLTNGLLTTQQSTLTTLSGRMTSNERLIRCTPLFPSSTGPGGAGFNTVPLQYQVIMGTPAA
jgi:hypothetical protein